MIRWLWRRPRRLALLLVVVAIGLLFPALYLVDGARAGGADGASGAHRTAAPAAGATGNTASTNAGKEDAVAADLAATYVTGYFSYTYANPAADPARLQHLSTPRLYRSLEQGADPTGLTVPWLAASAADDEVDSPVVTDTRARTDAGALNPSVAQDPVTATVDVTIHIHTSEGSDRVGKVMELALVESGTPPSTTTGGGSWLVDWIQQGQTQTAGAAP